ncbi:MAG TPA: PKD domain-containing protein [Candidatus Baltobacterales bacterium]|nr:PKD domain-containing protein [Candidatus Baltobacterales bacterium]
MKGKLAAALSTGALLALALAPTVHASTDVLDQSVQLLGTYLSYESLANMAETFTPSKDGRLDQVSLYAGTTGYMSTTFHVEIWTVAAGQPAAVYQFDSATQASTAVTAALGVTLQWRDFPLSKPVPLKGGTQYAIVVRANNSSFRWGYENSETYAGGKLWLCCSATGAWMSGSGLPPSFDFKTWMNTSANQAPVVAADNATVSVDEGTAAANTGTFSDPDGDAVTVTASTGSVTTSGGAGSGTWSWSQPASDESSSQTVTVTADDGKGLNAATTFTVNVAGVAPVAHISSGSAALAAATTTAPSSPEGTAVSLTASATSPAVADTSAGFAYTWIATKNGSAFSSGSGASFSLTPDDEGTFVVTLQAKDDGGLTGSTTRTFAGANVAPSATISGVTPSASLLLTAHEAVAFSGSFTDPGALDSHSVTWSFGDGATSTTSYGPGGSAGFSASHAYAAAGSYTVSLAVRDDDVGVGQKSVNVVVQTPQAALSTIAGYVQGLSTLNAGEKNSLIAKLNAASAAVGRGDTTAANNQLGAFLNELQADVNTGKVSPAAASVLRSAVHAVQAALGTFNRFLEWWPVEA